jgi:GH24 family phage-related lysozyme (muramidase)
MKHALQHLSTAILAFAMAAAARGQAASGEPRVQADASDSAAMAVGVPPAPGQPAVQLLRDFRDSDVKFDLRDLMEILRDHRHEGWVLAAYPDPKTAQPLIGAGVSLDLPAREHVQRDPLNPHPFLEPSSAELWQAAGLDLQRLKSILNEYSDRLAAWSKRGFRGRLMTLAPQITADEATQLLRIAAIQAIVNARAYCRNFDDLTASQQMAMTQLVYQMGVNLEEFSQFLNLINGEAWNASGTQKLRGAVAADAAYWKTVQQSLIHSQWARKYRVRALSVIAMLDPKYPDDPGMAERRVGVTLRPAVVHRRKGPAASSRQLASNSGHAGRPAHRRATRSRTKRTA